MTAPSGPILFNSSTGNDSTASGLGPATAVIGSSAELDGTSTVDLSYDGMDLSGISAGDLLFCDTTSGRKFSIIASVDTLNETITTDDAWGTESGVSWAVGGKRQYLFNSSYRTEFADAMQTGWAVNLESGYTETHNGSGIGFNTGDLRSSTSQTLTTITGDASSPATFVSIINSFATHFNFDGSSGVEFRNCSFAAYRGTSAGGTNEIQGCVKCANYGIMRNCTFLAQRTYDTYAICQANTSSVLIDCLSMLEDNSSYKYTKASGFGGRSYTLINCKVKNTKYGASYQSYSGAGTSRFLKCQFDSLHGVASGGNQYNSEMTVIGCIFKLQSGGIAWNISYSSWSYGMTAPQTFQGNVVTADGDAFTVIQSTNAGRFANSLWSYGNAIHNGTYDSSFPAGQNIDDNTTDPEITGDLATGNFVIGSQTVIDHVGLSPGVSGGGSSGSTFHPLAQ